MGHRISRWTLPTLLVLLVLAPCRAESEDKRSEEVFLYGCESDFTRREITLFANGTLRLREGRGEDQEIYLEELSPEAVEDELRVLRSVYSDSPLDTILQPMAGGLSGQWGERCRIHLALPELAEPLWYEFSPLEVTPLRISRLIHIAEELVRDMDSPAAERGIPGDYEPSFGDVLTDADGNRFRVLRFTADKAGVELQGLEQPVRIFVALGDLAGTFVAVEKKGVDYYWWRQ